MIYVGHAIESVMVSVCPDGQLNLTCSTATMSDETVLTWNMTFPHRPGYELRAFFSTGSAESALPLTVNQTNFQFLRTSTSPLISIIVINNMSTILNGTRVECSYGDWKETTILNVIGNGIMNIITL